MFALIAAEPNELELSNVLTTFLPEVNEFSKGFKGFMTIKPVV